MARNADNRIIIMTAHGSIDAAIEATRRGAYDFVHKSEDLSRRIAVAVKNAFEHREMTSRVSSLEEEVSEKYHFGNIVARSPEMRKLFETLRHVIDSKVTVLLQGESGTGKELVARAIHYEGPRKRGPFVAVNCAGIPETLLESELFGHERGAFTGAIAAKKGRFELADGGTLFLDEIGEMPVHLQAKLLRVLQERKVERIGSAQLRPVDVRIISATHRNLMDMVKDGRFREDLYYR
ncbi:MAG: sigma-54-dependent Fis family transcriptional regulator, partial [Myxococcales bacterium]|nr:sigma-54-dependent Fis family transcriptional regulator [Myxococcales bacterium]